MGDVKKAHKIAAPAPESMKPNITGRYEYISKSEKGNQQSFVVQINHVGTFLLLTVFEFTRTKDPYYKRKISFNCYGFRSNNPWVFNIKVSDGQSIKSIGNINYIRHETNKTIFIQLKDAGLSIRKEFHKVDAIPLASLHTLENIEGLPKAALTQVLVSEIRPIPLLLCSTIMNEIHTIFLQSIMSMHRILKPGAFKAGSQTKRAIRRRLSAAFLALDRALKEYIEAYAGLQSRKIALIDVNFLNLAKMVVDRSTYRTFHFNQLSLNTRVSSEEKFSIIIQNFARYAIIDPNDKGLPYLGKSKLNLIPPILDGWQKTEYQLDISSIGLVVSLGGTLGMLYVQAEISLKGKQSKKHFKKTKFTGVLMLIGGALGTKGGDVSLVAKGTGKTYFPRKPADFEGDVAYYEIALLTLKPGISIPNISKTTLRCDGTGLLPPIEFDLKGTTFGIGADAASVTRSIYGYLRAVEVAKPPKIVIRNKVPKFLASASSSKVHFEFGCSTLSVEGRNRLREMCARELRIFRSGQSTLKATGYTDRVDTDAFNLKLSKCRALNVIQAIKDILGPDYKVKQDSAVGLGEAPAMKEEEPDNQENRQWRKVEVTLDGRLVVSLYA